MNKRLLGLACALPIAAAAATSWDHALDEFPALPGEADDTARIQRAIDATPSGVLYVPKGLYKVSSPLVVTNLCSLDMHKSAILRAVSEMPYVLKVNNGTTTTSSWQAGASTATDSPRAWPSTGSATTRCATPPS